METWELGAYTLEFDSETHTYICNGIIVPSITQLIKIKKGSMYDGIPKHILNKAADRGTYIHKEIEIFEKLGQLQEYESQELKDYKFLKKYYGFECVENEVPIILFNNELPVAAGRLDMIIKLDNQYGIADIKTTSALDKEYLAYQLNLYKLGYEQTYNKQIDLLKAIHLKNGKRKFVDIPVNENVALNLIKEVIK